MIQFTALITANELISLIVIHHLNQILVFPQQHKTKPGLENKPTIIRRYYFAHNVCTLLQFAFYLNSPICLPTC